MAVQYRCARGERRLAVQKHPTIKGIDYLEVSGDQHELSVYFIEKSGGEDALPAVTADDIEITIGSVESGITVTDVQPDPPLHRLIVTVDDGKGNPQRVGGFSTYTLRLVQIPDVDTLFSSVDFSFKINCPGTLDCKPSTFCPGEPVVPPRIDYLSKDYASFRQLMLDRLSLILPEWTEESPADGMVALVELLAYAADHLSYYQDAVATEAYLGTARKRVSIKRHARLLDYHMHDGRNARVWVSVWLEGYDGHTLPGPSAPEEYPPHGGTKLLTKAASFQKNSVIPPDRIEEAMNEGALVFETMHTITLYLDHREMDFYTWGNADCCLPRGATKATLAGHKENLKTGDVLVLAETSNPENGGPPNPARRHAVRLTDVTTMSEDGVTNLTDPLLDNQEITAIAWGPDDALPFPLCISAGGAIVSKAYGNIVLADHGMTVGLEDIGTVPENGPFTPVLSGRPVTQQAFLRTVTGSAEELLLYDPDGPASSVIIQKSAYILPSVKLYDKSWGAQDPWHPARDLLESDEYALDFVLDTEEDGTSRIRFGNDITGRRPASGHPFGAMYRTGNGTAGNIGHDTITHIVISEGEAVPASVNLCNPLPASGGTAPEPLEQVRLDAPQTFRTQERAVTIEDYAEITGRHPDVQKAVASRRWTGSWYTFFIAIDRKGGKALDDSFKDEILEYLEKYRLAGHDIEIVQPSFVPLDIELKVCVLPEYLSSDIRGVLIDLFSSRSLPDGTKGFFHPDNFTFGQSIYLSSLIAAAMQVPGVRCLEAPVLKRYGRQSGNDEVIEIFQHEIARVDNDPDNIQNGRIVITMTGGI